MGKAVTLLEGIADSMSMPSESVGWEEWAGCSQPHLQPLPPAWEPVCNTFHRLLLLKVPAPQGCLAHAHPSSLQVHNEKPMLETPHAKTVLPLSGAGSRADSACHPRPLLFLNGFV